MKRSINYIIELCLSLSLLCLLISLTYNLSLNPLGASYLTWSVYFLLIFFLILILLQDRITEFSIQKYFSIKMEKVKEEVLATKQEILDMYKNILKSHITIIQNSNRWSGWAKERYDKEVKNIRDKAIASHFTEPEIKEIFEQKIYWDNIDIIYEIKNKISENIINDEQKQLLEEEWNEIVNSNVTPEATWLIKFIKIAKLEKSVEAQLLDEISKYDSSKGFNKFLKS